MASPSPKPKSPAKSPTDPTAKLPDKNTPLCLPVGYIALHCTASHLIAHMGWKGVKTTGRNNGGQAVSGGRVHVWALICCWLPAKGVKPLRRCNMGLLVTGAHHQGHGGVRQQQSPVVLQPHTQGE
jgi:hypothetical protein